jgi:uncharacterized CHY-type Zn-finger protein
MRSVIPDSITNFPEGASNSLAHSVFKKQFDHFKTEPGIIVFRVNSIKIWRDCFQRRRFYKDFAFTVMMLTRACRQAIFSGICR